MVDNLLVLGNGFDLALGRKTSYGDFLSFLNTIEELSSIFHNWVKSHLGFSHDELSGKSQVLSHPIPMLFETRQTSLSLSIKKSNVKRKRRFFFLTRRLWTVT